MNTTMTRTIKLVIFYGIQTSTTHGPPVTGRTDSGLTFDYDPRELSVKYYKLTKMVDVSIDNSNPYTEFIELLTNIESRYLEIQPLNINSESIKLNVLDRNSDSVRLNGMRVFVYRCIS